MSGMVGKSIHNEECTAIFRRCAVGITVIANGIHKAFAEYIFFPILQLRFHSALHAENNMSLAAPVIS